MFFALIFNQFWLRFGSQVGSMLATKTPPRRPRTPPRRAQGAPGGRQDTPRSLKRPQDASKIDFWWIFDRFWVDFSLFFDRIFHVLWMEFWLILHVFWIVFFANWTGIYLILDGILGAFRQRLFTSSSKHNQCVIILSRFPLFL